MDKNDFDNLDLDLNLDDSNPVPVEPSKIKDEPLPIVKPVKSDRFKLIAIGSVFMIALVASGSWYMMMKKTATTANVVHKNSVNAKAQYYKIDPDFIMNIKNARGDLSHMQVEVTIVYRDEKLKTVLEEHQPVLKNNLLNLFSTQPFDKLQNFEFRQVLKDKALKIVNDALVKEGVHENVDSILFTKFIME